MIVIVIVIARVIVIVIMIVKVVGCGTVVDDSGPTRRTSTARNAQNGPDACVDDDNAVSISSRLHINPPHLNHSPALAPTPATRREAESPGRRCRCSILRFLEGRCRVGGEGG